jgi:hypothetical protein
MDFSRAECFDTTAMQKSPSASSRSRGRSSFGQFFMRSDFMLLP